MLNLISSAAVIAIIAAGSGHSGSHGSGLPYHLQCTVSPQSAPDNQVYLDCERRPIEPAIPALNPKAASNGWFCIDTHTSDFDKTRSIYRPTIYCRNDKQEHRVVFKDFLK